MDLQNVNLGNAINANLLDKKFKNLKWITPFFSGTPQEEIDLLKKTVETMRNDNRKKMVITPYQFFSIILEEDLSIPNRWYGFENASYPSENHKYFEFYKEHFEENLANNNIQVIYTVGFPQLEDFQPYMPDICFEKRKINEIASSHELKKC